MGARKRAIIGVPPSLEIQNPYRGLFSKWGPFFSLLRPCLDLPLLQKNSVGVHGFEQTKCWTDAVTVTKATQIHGTSNVMFVYALQEPETAT